MAAASVVGACLVLSKLALLAARWGYVGAFHSDSEAPLMAPCEGWLSTTVNSQRTHSVGSRRQLVESVWELAAREQTQQRAHV